jgi:hypothetical protein
MPISTHHPRLLKTSKKQSHKAKGPRTDSEHFPSCTPPPKSPAAITRNHQYITATQCKKIQDGTWIPRHLAQRLRSREPPYRGTAADTSGYPPPNLPSCLVKLSTPEQAWWQGTTNTQLSQIVCPKRTPSSAAFAFAPWPVASLASLASLAPPNQQALQQPFDRPPPSPVPGLVGGEQT